jgi:small subunit ribosomal protein S17
MVDQAGRPDTPAGRFRRRAVRTGIVISSKMDKTVVVAVERRVSHPRYDRVVSRTSKFYAHDERNTCKPGDVVTIVETRPLSRLKRWRVRSVVREGRTVVEEPAAEAAEPGTDRGIPAGRRRQDRGGEGAAAPEAGPER